MRRALVDMRPDRFEDIIALVALIVPVDGEHPDLLRLASMATRSRISASLSSRSEGDLRRHHLPGTGDADRAGHGRLFLGEADLLRRAMGKKIRAEMEQQRARFIEGSVKNGVPKGRRTRSSNCWRNSRYGFNKSHAAAYALVSYHTAYMKAHYPVEFLAASMTLELTTPTSCPSFAAEASASASRSRRPTSIVQGRPSKSATAPSIRACRTEGVGRKPSKLIVATRKEGTFTSLADFAARVNPRAINKRVIESLAAAGAFDTLDSNRARVFAGAEAILAACQRSHEARRSDRTTCSAAPRMRRPSCWPQIEPWLPAERLRANMMPSASSCPAIRSTITPPC